MRRSDVFPSEQSHPTHEEQLQAEVPAEMEQQEQEEVRLYSGSRGSGLGSEALLFLAVWGPLLIVSVGFFLLLAWLLS